MTTEKLRMVQIQDNFELQKRNEMLFRQIDTIQTLINNKRLFEKIDSLASKSGSTKLEYKLSKLEIRFENIVKVTDGLRQAIKTHQSLTTKN